MSLAAMALAPLLAVAGPEVHALRLTSVDSRPALRILTSEEVPMGSITREGGEVVVRLPALAADGLVAPNELVPPLEAIRIEREPAATVLRVRVAPEVPFEIAHEPGMTTVVFGERPAAELRGPVNAELHARLFPAAAAGSEPAAEARSDEGEGELSVGRISVRPSFTASWVDADLQAGEQPQPVRARYLQLGPGVTVSAPLSLAVLAADYEPRFRFFSNLPGVAAPSHAGGARLELPVGGRTTLRLGHRFSRATLETATVDAGREYFYDLSRYTFHHSTLGLRIELGPRLFLDGDAGWRWARFDDREAGFFDYDSRTARAGLGYDLGVDLRAVVSYSLERVPPSADRALVETSARTVMATLSGSLGPLMTGSLTAGYRTQTSPQAEGESRSFRGVTASAVLRRELGHASSLSLQLNRATQLSAFEANSYYVTNSAGLQLAVPLPLEVSGNATVSFLRNSYPNDASALGAPRRDDVLGWSLGLGRQLGWRAWIRADYRRERRDSNIPGFDVTTDGYVVQLGLGLPGAGTR